MRSKLKLEKIAPKEYGHVYQLMRLQNFPNTPPTLEEAALFLSKAQVYGAWVDRDLAFCIVFIPSEHGSACVDGVCSPAWHGKWATRRIVLEILAVAFKQLKFSYLWTVSNRNKAQIFTRKLGFSAAGKTKDGVLSILTPRTLTSKWKELYYGITI